MTEPSVNLEGKAWFTVSKKESLERQRHLINNAVKALDQEGFRDIQVEEDSEKIWISGKA